jgi:hypothetical protein
LWIISKDADDQPPILQTDCGNIQKRVESISVSEWSLRHRLKIKYSAFTTKSGMKI